MHALRVRLDGGGVEMVDKWWWVPLALILVPVGIGAGGYVMLAALVVWAALRGPDLFK